MQIYVCPFSYAHLTCSLLTTMLVGHIILIGIGRFITCRRSLGSLAGKPLAGFRATPSRRNPVLYGMVVYAIRFKNPLLHRQSTLRKRRLGENRVSGQTSSITTTDCQIWCLIFRIRPRARNRGTLVAVRFRSKSVAKITRSDKPSL